MTFAAILSLGGVTSVYVHPQGGSIISGQSALIRTVNTYNDGTSINSVITTLDENIIVSDSVGIHGNIGNSARGATVGSISSEFSELRAQFVRAMPFVGGNATDDVLPYVRLLKREIPLVIRVDQVKRTSQNCKRFLLRKYFWPQLSTKLQE